MEEKDSRIANKALSHPDIPDGPGNYLLTFEDKLLYKRFLLRNFIPHCVLNALNLQLKRKIFPLAVNLLDKARRIEFYGSGGSGMVAMDAHHKFFRLAVPCIAYQNSHMQVMSAALLSSDCVVIAIKKFNGVRKNLGKVKQTLIEKRY